jgi:hypothetical protein
MIEVEDSNLAVRNLIAEATVASVILSGIARTGFNETGRSKKVCLKVGRNLQRFAAQAAKALPDDDWHCSFCDFKHHDSKVVQAHETAHAAPACGNLGGGAK